MNRSENSYISEEAIIGANVKIGHFCVIEDGVIIGDNVIIEHHCVLKKGVVIGEGTTLKNYVELREDTIIGKNCLIDSRVSSSGNNRVGNNVTLRYDTILARQVEIGDNTYVCPRVMTNNLDSSKSQIGGAKIGANCFIGTNAVLQYGIVLEDNVVIGSMAFVNKDCDANGTYIGIPATKK
jgi:UDP-2-acetamido-3-amino-2,3-dideoxy-glucuronate N-acetyltransferase